MDSSFGSRLCPRFARWRGRAPLNAWLLCFAVRRHGPITDGEHGDLTGSWDAHPVPLPCSPLTPAGPPHPPSRCFGAAPAANTTKAPTTKQFRGSITRLQHRLSTLHDGHHCPPCKTRLRLVVSLYREGVEPSGHRKRFPLMMVSCASSFPKLILSHIGFVFAPARTVPFLITSFLKRS